MTAQARELVLMLVEARLAEKDWMFNTLPDRTKPSSDIKSRIGSFVGSSQAQGVIHHTASKVLNTVKQHHKHILTTAVAMALTHVAPHHADVVLNPDIEHSIHHEIEHLGTSLSISKTMAHHALTHAVGKLKELRGIKEDKDDELDHALVRLHKLLKLIEPHYNPKPEPKPKSEK
jgi:hypothetical protein